MFTFAPQTVEQYTAAYPQLAQALGSSRTQPGKLEIELLNQVVGSEKQHHEHYYNPGSLGIPGIFFLVGFASILGAKRSIEIGTASGFSAAMLTAAMVNGYEERQEALPKTLLHTVDRKDKCLFDGSKPIGFMIQKMVPHLAQHIQLNCLQDASLCASLVEKESIDFAFIDGNHQHPWPLLDVLYLLPLMKPGSWFMLDDVDLPDLYDATLARRGPRYVLESWPFATVRGSNVAALYLPESDLGWIPDWVKQLLQKPLEVSESGWKRYRKMIDELVENLMVAV